ncbi:MAG: hypothetical protein ABI954_08730, partial [Pyrinomonadaceae bacterium]
IIANAPFKSTKQQSRFFGLGDEFNENSLAPDLSQLLSDNQTAHLSDGFLTLAPTEKQLLVEKMLEIVVAERSVSGTFTGTTRIDFAKMKLDEFAGISAYSWRENAVGISFGNGKIFTWRREDGKQKEIAHADLPANQSAIYLRIKAQGGEIFEFADSIDGKSWQTVGDKINFGNLEGARLAVIYNGKTTNVGARFDWLRVEQ